MLILQGGERENENENENEDKRRQQRNTSTVEIEELIDDGEDDWISVQSSRQE